jgi:hypothetical protein
MFNFGSGISISRSLISRACARGSDRIEDTVGRKQPREPIEVAYINEVMALHVDLAKVQR